MFTSKSIELFYLLFQGMLLFQTFFLGILYLITKRKDILYYSFFLLLTALYFFLNAPNTFFGLDDDSIFSSTLYRYSNIPLIVITNLFYILFLKIFFAGVYTNKTLHKFFNIIFLLTPVLIAIFFLLRYLGKDTQSIFYIVNLLAAGVSIFIITGVIKNPLPNTGWVAWGMFFNILGTALTILMIVLERQGIRNLITLGYPLIFMRCGILADMFFYQVALLQKWHHQEKELAVEKIHSQLEVEKLRNKISSELHDDIGSTLSGIAMYSHMTDGQLLNGNYDKAKDSVTVIQKSATELVGKLSDLVWVINPHHESFTAMLEKIEQYGEEMCRAKEIIFTTSFSPAVVNLHLPMESRLQIYLILKEAINNAVKYSNASSLQLNMKALEGKLLVTIGDNGNGFDAATAIMGNGIENMQKRAAEIDASFKIDSQKAKGTLVQVSINLPQ
jgi:signal transduction histidine kinase